MLGCFKGLYPGLAVDTQSLVLIRMNMELSLCHEQNEIYLESVLHMAHSVFRRGSWYSLTTSTHWLGRYSGAAFRETWYVHLWSSPRMLKEERRNFWG